MNDHTAIMPGDVVELFEQKRQMAALCLGYKKNRLNLITETSKLLSLSTNRVIHVSHKRIDPNTARKTAIEILRELSLVRDRIAASVNLEALWNRLPHKGTWIDLTTLECPEELQSEGFNHDDCKAGILRAINLNKCFFRYNENALYIHSPDEVRSSIKRLEDQEKENATITSLARWLEGKIHGHELPAPGRENYTRLIDGLKSEVAQQTEFSDGAFLSAVMKQVQIGPGMTHFDVLVRLGEFQPDENLDILKLRYPVSFSQQAQAEFEQLQKSLPQSDCKRYDLTEIPCFTIDGPQTLDFDDALSYLRLPDGRQEIGVHITDVPFYIPPGSFLDEESRERGQTLYLPQKTWHMFPTAFAESLASLQCGCIRPAISIQIVFSSRLDIESVSIRPSEIRVARRLTYDQVDSEIQSEPFASLLQIANQLRQSRLRDGAIIMPRPEILIDARDPRKVVIQKRNRQTDSQLIVSELMILANREVARLAAESNLPFPFRCQQTPEEPVPRCDDVFNPYIAYCQRRLMPRADQSLTPRQHFTLGLESYTNITSPMRRYFDVLAQRQFKAVLGLEEPYSRQEMGTLMKDLEQSVARAATISYRQHRYWLLKYLAGLQGQTISAMVLDRFANGYQIWLEDMCMDADLPLSFGKKLYPEQVVNVIIEKVLPREDILKLRLED